MSSKPDKPLPAKPLSRGELACTAILLALCLLANAWLGAIAPEAAPKPAAASSPAPTPTDAGSRPERERPSQRERQWRDPAALALPNL